VFMEGFIQALAEFMGVDITTAGLTMTTILTVSVIIAITAGTGGKNCELPIATSSVIMVILCTVFGWVNIWISVFYTLVVSVGVGYYLSRTGGRG